MRRSQNQDNCRNSTQSWSTQGAGAAGYCSLFLWKVWTGRIKKGKCRVILMLACMEIGRESIGRWLELEFSKVVLVFRGGLDDKESAYNVGDLGLISESGRSPGEGNGNPLQFSFLAYSMDRGAWRGIVHGVARRHDRATNTSLLRLYWFSQFNQDCMCVCSVVSLWPQGL